MCLKYIHKHNYIYNMHVDILYIHKHTHTHTGLMTKRSTDMDIHPGNSGRMTTDRSLICQCKIAIKKEHNLSLQVSWSKNRLLMCASSRLHGQGGMHYHT